MKKILILIMVTAVGFAQFQKPLGTNVIQARTTFTNFDGLTPMIFIKTGQWKINMDLSMVSTNAGSIVIHRTPYPTNTWTAANLVARLATNYTSYTSNVVKTNVFTNVVTAIWTGVIVNGASRSVTNNLLNRTNITTYRYTVPFAITLTNISVLGVTNDDYLAAATTNTWTNQTTYTNSRTLTLNSNYWVNVTNYHLSHFRDLNKTNSIVTNIVTIYTSNYIYGQKKYIATNYVTNTVTNQLVFNKTNIITNYFYNAFTNRNTIGLITLKNYTNATVTATFTLSRSNLATNLGTVVTSNYFPNGYNKVLNINVPKDSLYMIRIIGSTNSIIYMNASEVH